jgi:hypothetical protein
MIRLNLGSSCFHSVENLFIFYLSIYIKIKVKNATLGGLRKLHNEELNDF